MAGEKIESQSAVGCAPGTTVEVRDLFFNVPARRKFLRGANTEFGHIQEQLARLALPNPHVEFEFVHNKRVVKHLPPCDNMLQRISSFYGDDLAQDLISIRRDERGLAIDGYAAMPAQNRSSSKWQYFFLNGRHIRDRFLQHAVKEAYRGLMEQGRFPVVFLALAAPWLEARRRERTDWRSWVDLAWRWGLGNSLLPRRMNVPCPSVLMKMDLFIYNLLRRLLW